MDYATSEAVPGKLKPGSWAEGIHAATPILTASTYVDGRAPRWQSEFGASQFSGTNRS